MQQISMDMVRALTSAVEHAGASRGHFIARAGLGPEQLGDRALWLSVPDYRRVIEAALEVTGDPALGLHLGEQTSSMMFQLLAHLVEHAATLGDALDVVARYTELLAQDFKPSIALDDQHAALRFPWLCGDDPTVRVMSDLAMTGLLRLLRQYVGELVRDVRVSFGHPEPSPLAQAEYKRIFGDRAQFAQRCTALRFPRAWLARTQLHANPELQQLLKLQADRQLALQHTPTTSARVLQLLAANDPRALPTMPSVARVLGMSTRTLTRKLTAEAVSFAELIVCRRRDAAQRYLEQGVHSVQEIAEIMGFADTSAFHKAFKRWTGQTPMQYVASVKVSAD